MFLWREARGIPTYAQGVVMQVKLPLVAGVLVSSLIVACGGSSDLTPPPAAPVISSFTASPSSIVVGGSSTLAWTVSGATSLSINQGVGGVAGTSTTVSPTTTTTYSLTATNAGGSVTATTTVTVSSTPPPAAPVISSFTASPSSIVVGGSSTLAWTVSGATSLSINQGVGGVAGTSTTVSPTTTTTYSLTATNAGGSVTATTTVTVSSTPPPAAPVISSFTASPSSIVVGGSSTLAWTVSGATSLSINQGVGGVAGTSTTVSPTTTTTYSLTATNAGGSVTATTTVTVSQVPVSTVTVSVANSTIYTGHTTQATAVTRDASGNVLAGRAVTWGTNNGSVATVDTVGLVSAVGVGTVIITATSEGRVGTASIAVIAPVAKVTVGFANNIGNIPVGQTIQASALLQDAAGNSLEGRAVSWRSASPTVATVDAVTGLVSAVAPGTTSIEATSEGRTGSAILTVHPPVATVGILPSSFSFVVGQALQLSADVRDASGNVLSGAIVAWTSSDPSVVAVSDAGYAWGVSGGTATISAVSEGKTGIASSDVIAFKAVAAGSFSTCGIASSGLAYCWGWNWAGAVGDGTTTDRFKPVAVIGGNKFIDIVTTRNLSCGITEAGIATGWGYVYGFTPTVVPDANIYTKVSGKEDVLIGLTSNGSALRWYGPNPQYPIPGGLVFTDIASGLHVSCGIVSPGAAYCWGSNAVGELGDGTTVDSDSPVAVIGGLSFVSLAAGDAHVCGLTSSGAVYCWGGNASGQLGDGTTTNRSSPVPVGGGVSFVSLSAAGEQTCGLAQDNTAYCWGSNSRGQLGDGTRTEKHIPVGVYYGIAFRTLSCGLYHTCATTASGAAYCWGDDRNGQLGWGRQSDAVVPVMVNR